MEKKSINLPLKNLIRVSEAKEKSPSIFFLHGFGSNMMDLYGLAGAFPRDWTCVSLEASIPVQANGWAWAELDFINLPKLPKPEQMEIHQESVVLSVKEAIKQLNLDEKKVNLLGFSQGASLSIFSGLMNPHLYNTVIALCGFMPVKEVVQKIKNKDLSMMKLFMGNGIQDPIVALELADKTFDDLKRLGVVDPVYKKYDAEHTISNECIRDFLHFLKINNS